MSTVFRRVRTIGNVDLDSVEPIKAQYKVGNQLKDVIFKQYDYGSCIHLNLDMGSFTDIDLNGDTIYATFAINQKLFEPKKILTDSTGKPIEQLCPILPSGETEVLLPLELMQESGNVTMEMVIIENEVYRLTGPTITFTINKSISAVTHIPSRYTYVVDENGNYVVDEDGNYVIG